MYGSSLIGSAGSEAPDFLPGRDEITIRPKTYHDDTGGILAA